MKYIFIGLVLAFIGFTNTLTAVAQQQINNNGATGGELQQYINGSALQNAPADQQTSPVTPNAGAKTLQNAPNAPLKVTGEQTPQETPENSDRSSFGWITLSVLMLLLLMSPALLYAQSISKKEQAIAAPVDLEVKQKEPQVVEAPPKEPTNKASATTKTPKKKSKKSANKVKRKKKKK